MKKYDENITFLSSNVFEFIASLYVLENHEQLIPELKSVKDYQPPMELTNWVEEKRRILPDKMKEEIKVFFNYETFIGLTMIRFAYRTQTFDSIEAFLLKLKYVSPYVLFSSFLRTGFTKSEVKDIKNSDEVLRYIEDSTIQEQEKWKLTYLYLNIEQTKERFVSLLNNYFSNYFQDDLEILNQYHSSSYDDLVEAGIFNSRQKLKQVFSAIPDDILNNLQQEIVLSPSFFYDVASMMSEDDQNSFIYLYGINQPKHIKQFDFSEKNLLEAVKVLADEKRIKMIKLLSKSSNYGYELAQKLGLSNSTVSHHLSVLSSIGVVTPRRIENKVYFELDKEKIADLLNALSEYLTE